MLSLQSTPVLLHADANEGDARLVARSFELAEQDVDIVHAVDGKVAIDLIDRIEQDLLPKPDFILLDVKLPFYSGAEVLARAKSSSVLRMVPIVMLTLSNAPRDWQRCLAAGCSDYLLKPIGYHEFIELVQRIGHRFLPSRTCSLREKVSVL